MESPIYFDSRWNGPHGIGRFSAELEARLPGVVPLRIMGRKLSPIDALASSAALARKRHGFFLSPGFNPPLRSPIPFAFTIHDLVHLRVPQESSALRRLYYAAVVRPAAARAWRILTVSEYSRRDIVEWAGIPEGMVKVVGNGVSTVFAPGSGTRQRPRYLLHVGRRVGHKNIPRLLAAYAGSRARTKISLVFTGVPDPATVEAARKLGITERISFVGTVSDEELADLYRGAQALVFPSLHEGFGLPIVEAMACGTPVLTSSVTSMAEVAGADNALLLDPTDTDAMTAAIDRIVEDDLLCATLSSRGLARAGAFTWASVADRVREALGEMP